jgi:hypothetical protein
VPSHAELSNKETLMKAAQREMQERLGTLWMECRWLENAHRYYADLITGFMAIELPGKIDPPGPICVPPKVCRMSLADLKERLEHLEEVSSEFRRRLGEVIDDAVKNGVEEVTFRPSQLPAFPQTKETAAAKPSAAAAR